MKDVDQVQRKVDSDLENWLLKLVKDLGYPKGATLNKALGYLKDDWNTKIGVIGSDHVTAEEYQTAKDILAEKTKELEDLRAEYEDFKAMHERWKEHQPAMIKERVARINKQAQEATANAKIEVAKIKGTSQMASAAMSAAAKEGKFVDTFGDTIKDMIPSIFPVDNRPQLKEAERAER